MNHKQSTRLFPFLILLLTILVQTSTYAQRSATVRGSNVNVRACAELTCDVNFQVNTGDNCEVLFNMKDENIVGYGINSWYKIKYNGQEGFIYGAFLDFISDDLKSDSININADLSKITGNEVNARTCGGLLCNKAFRLNKGDEVKVVGKTSEYFVPGIGKKSWLEVEYNGQTGYVFEHFLDCTNCDFDAGSSNTQTNIKIGTVTGDNVNIRDCESTNCNVIYKLSIGDSCIVKSTLQDTSYTYAWHHIEHQGKEGYIYGKYLSVPSGFQKTVKIWALIAGIADYSTLSNIYGVTDLNYSASDAKKVYQFLKSPEGGNIPDTQIKLLRDEEATKEEILNYAQTLFSQAGPDDLVVVYFSGHGGPNYFLAHDQPLKYSDIKMVIENSSAQKRLCIADACYSGTWSDNATVNISQKTMTDEQLERLYYDALSNSGNGIALFMSSKRDETSLEIPKIQQGLFTYAYIEGLKGAADLDGNKIITIQELYEFVRYGVSGTAKQYFNHNQNPNLSGFFDNSMPVGVVRK